MLSSGRTQRARHESTATSRATVNSRGAHPVGFAAEDARVLPRAQQRLLGDVLGPARVAPGQAQAEAPQRIGVLLARGAHQLFVQVGRADHLHI